MASPFKCWPIKPMLAEKAKEPLDSEEFLYELKWDGTRCIAYIQGSNVRLQNRRLLDITYRYPEFGSLAKAVDGEDVILDGEIVMLKEGVPDFKTLQRREHITDPHRISILSRLSPAMYIVFDILYFRQERLFKRPLMERRRLLEELVREGEHIIISRTYREGIPLFREAVKRGFEGIMAKERRSLYQPGVRSRSWLKIKKTIDIDAVVCGWIDSEKRPFASLVLGLYRNSTLVHIGQVGTGFTEKERREIIEILREKETGVPLFEHPSGVRWVIPDTVVRVTAMEWTESGKLRAPVFLGLRSDKRPEECIYRE